MRIIATVLWAVVAIKLMALAAVCVAFPFVGTAMLVTNLLLSLFSPMRNSAWAFTLMLAVNAVLWQIAGLCCPGLLGAPAMLCAFVFAIAVWLPFPVLRAPRR